MVDIRFFDLITCVAKCLDLVNPALSLHHLRTALIAGKLARSLNLSSQSVSNVTAAGMLHDVGAFTQRSRLDALVFETDGRAHAETGYRLLATHAHFQGVAKIVRHHHTFWDFGRSLDRFPDMSAQANILFLADRCEVLLPRNGRTSQTMLQGLRQRVDSWSESVFAPDVAQCLLDICADRDFWREIDAPTQALCEHVDTLADPSLLVDDLVEFAKLMARLIDFRSRYTATHSHGVAAVAGEMAGLAGFSAEQKKIMRAAGYLHDIGKLAVPAELLHKAGPLTPEEYRVVQGHARAALETLSSIPRVGQLCRWAGEHHERLDGSGYPGGLAGDELSTGSRLMAVADVFTALAEERPYRPGMDRAQTLEVMGLMAAKGRLDPDMCGLLFDNLPFLDDLRASVQNQALREFTALGLAGD